MKNGKVYLVGAGPGDQKLITIKGLQSIQKADVILYDRLVNPLLLEEAPASAELIYCGKLPQKHTLRQEKINELLVTKSQQGKTVVRLKGGDPSIFGRVGEEAETLIEHGIEYEIIPGITSGIAASVYAGVPMTHRDYATSFAVVTGHEKDKNGKPNIDWKSLAQGVDTIAFYMGIGNLDDIAKQLINHGKAASTPVILIQWGTYSRQNSLEGTLATIVQKAKAVNFKNPAIILVGPIIALRKKLNWFEKKPLFGKSIIFAKSDDNSDGLISQLEDHGADVFAFPRFSTTTLLSERTTMQKFKKLSYFKQILFTCPKSVTLFFQGLSLYNIDIRNIRADFFVKDEATKQQLAKFGCTYKSELEISLTQSLLVVGGKTSDIRGVATNSRFDYLATHRIQVNSSSLETLKRVDSEAMMNTVIFSSPKSVELMLQGLDKVGIARNMFLAQKSIVTIGDKTYTAVVKKGLTVNSHLEKPSIKQLIYALKQENVLIYKLN